MDSVILETKDLSFQDMIHYQDIKVKKEKVNFIVGSSGTGKSTLLRLFNGTLSPSKGSILYNDRDISEIDTIELRTAVLLISQSVFLFEMSIRENFTQFYEYRGLEPPADQVIRQFLDICCVPFPLEQNCTTMSGGERQRIYIAIFLSFHPEVILLDEPTSALDKENSHNVINNVLHYCKEKGITVVVVSHDPHITDTFAENIITIARRAQG